MKKLTNINYRLTLCSMMLLTVIFLLTGCNNKEIEEYSTFTSMYPVYEDDSYLYLSVRYTAWEVSLEHHVLIYDKDSKEISLYDTLAVDEDNWEVAPEIIFKNLHRSEVLSSPYVFTTTNKVYDIRDKSYIDVSSNCIPSESSYNCAFLPNDIAVTISDYEDGILLDISSISSGENITSRIIQSSELNLDDGIKINTYLKNDEYLGIVLVPGDNTKESVVLKYNYSNNNIELVTSEIDFKYFDFDLDEGYYYFSCRDLYHICIYDQQFNKISEYEYEYMNYKTTYGYWVEENNERLISIVSKNSDLSNNETYTTSFGASGYLMSNMDFFGVVQEANGFGVIVIPDNDLIHEFKTINSENIISIIRN